MSSADVLISADMSSAVGSSSGGSSVLICGDMSSADVLI